MARKRVVISAEQIPLLTRYLCFSLPRSSLPQPGKHATGRFVARFEPQCFLELHHGLSSPALHAVRQRQIVVSLNQSRFVNQGLTILGYSLVDFSTAPVERAEVQVRFRVIGFEADSRLELLGSRGFWRMARRYWRVGSLELMRSWSKRAFLSAARRLVPSLDGRDLQAGDTGVRAQAVDGHGTLVDDFVIQESAQALHVCNAPSPAATASLGIGEAVAARCEV